MRTEGENEKGKFGRAGKMTTTATTGSYLGGT